MSERVSLLTVYQQLPQTNCGECGLVNCMSFAAELIERKKKVEDCPPLLKPEYKRKLTKLVELISPPIKEVVIGRGRSIVKVGGKEVLYRHELTYHNPTAIAIDVADSLGDDKIVERCGIVETRSVVRIGEDLRLNLVALRCNSGDPHRFADAASLISKKCSLPFILCTLDAGIMATALKRAEVSDRRPLLYAATKENWREMGLLAKENECPIVAYSPDDLSTLKSLTIGLKELGVEDIVLDPGTYIRGKELKDAVNNLVMLRRLGIQRRDKDLGYPIISIPAVVWCVDGEDAVTKAYQESIYACLFLSRYSDIIVMHTLEPWALLPVLTLRQNIYTDPRKPVAVESGLKSFGQPDKDSPVLLTTNFALTYYTVANDLEAAGVTCHLLVLDTGGLAVEVSVAGGQFTAAGVEELMTTSNVGEAVEHRRLVIPQLAARLKGDIEDATKWEVIVGPRDSSQIKNFLAKNWPQPKAE